MTKHLFYVRIKVILPESIPVSTKEGVNDSVDRYIQFFGVIASSAQRAADAAEHCISDGEVAGVWVSPWPWEDFISKFGAPQMAAIGIIHRSGRVLFSPKEDDEEEL